MTFNSISDQATGYCRAKSARSRILFNASVELGNRLQKDGIDYNDGLLALSSVAGGTGESVGNIGFTGHNASIDRMNKILYLDNPNYRLRKVGVLNSFGFVDRVIYAPVFQDADRIEFRPGLLWDPTFARVTGEAYAQSLRCFIEDWDHQLRFMRGLYLLFHLQENLIGRNKSKRYATRLADMLFKDREAGVFSYLSDLDKAKAFDLVA